MSEPISVEEFSAKFKGEAIGILAEEIAGFFKMNGGPNYLEIEFGSVDDELGPLILTVQRKDGKTPAQLRIDAEEESLQLLRGQHHLMRLLYEALETGGIESEWYKMNHDLKLAWPDSWPDPILEGGVIPSS